jgi:hypothetical protein
VSYILATTRIETRSRSRQCGRCVSEARDRFRRFHCFPPKEMIYQPCSRLIPRVLVHVGRLKGLIYSSEKGDGRQRTYIHFMEKPPRLACNSRGDQLYIVGGRYRITARGIEG